MIYYKKRALDFLRKDLRFDKACVEEKIEGNSGKTINHYRINTLAVATTPLTEGSYPNEASMTMTTFNFTVAQYGNWVKTTDMLEVTERSSTMDQFSRNLGYNGGHSLDTVSYSAWKSGATAHYANNTDANSFQADSTLTSKELRRLAKKFRANSVRPMDDGYYYLFIHPDQEMDIITDDNFGSVVDLQRRNSEGDKNVEMGLVGIYGGFKVFTTSLIDTTTITNGNGSFTAYQAIAAGYGAMVSVGLSKMPFNLFVNPSSNVNIANPIAQLGSIGWKAAVVYGWVGSDGPRAYKVLSTASEPTV
jgi:N4-gp56 family major capsid protein